MLNLRGLAFLLLGVGLIIGGLEVVFSVAWSPKLAWAFLMAAGICLVLEFVGAERLANRTSA